jgi:uncharacterized protein
MKRTLLFVSFFTAFTYQAQEALLWKITPKNAKTSSYLFGTMHATCDATLSKNVLKALDETKQLCLELDADDPSLQADMIKEANMKDNVTLSSLISKSDAEILNEYFTKNIGAPLMALENLKPFFISSMFIQKLLDCEAKSIEGALMQVSLEQNETVIGLETISDQMGVFDKIPYDFQAQELVNSIKDNYTKDKVEFTELMNLYAKGDIEGMMKLSEKSSSKLTKNYGNIMIDERNVLWIDKIEKITSEKPTFFGVGALHLPGENGVIELLRKRGFTVEVVQ